LKPLSPTGPGWTTYPIPYWLPVSEGAEGWFNTKSRIAVISSIDATLKDNFEYHLSINVMYRPCSMEEVMETLRMFGMDNAEEDNTGTHGNARHFWQPVIEETNEESMGNHLA
jgi:hypothetical protein